MVYLKDFLLPKDTWTDFYLSPIKNPDFWPPDLPEDMPVASKMTCFQSWYPWKTFYNRSLRHIEFDDITIFYGGNGSGKTRWQRKPSGEVTSSPATMYSSVCCNAGWKTK